MSELPVTSGNFDLASSERTPSGIPDGPRTLKYTDYLGILAEQFGDRFRIYRTEYKQSQHYDKNGYVPRFPLTVTLELVNRCNLECVMCFTINHNEKKNTLK